MGLSLPRICLVVHRSHWWTNMLRTSTRLWLLSYQPGLIGNGHFLVPRESKNSWQSRKFLTIPPTGKTSMRRLDTTCRSPNKSNSVRRRSSGSRAASKLMRRISREIRKPTSLPEAATPTSVPEHKLPPGQWFYYKMSLLLLKDWLASAYCVDPHWDILFFLDVKMPTNRKRYVPYEMALGSVTPAPWVTIRDPICWRFFIMNWPFWPQRDPGASSGPGKCSWRSDAFTTMRYRCEDLDGGSQPASAGHPHGGSNDCDGWSRLSSTSLQGHFVCTHPRIQRVYISKNQV